MRVIDKAPLGRKRNLTPLTDEQRQLVTDHLNFAKWKVLDRTGRGAYSPGSNGRFEARYNDYGSIAIAAAVEAARLFKPELGYKFETYAGRAIHNALSKSGADTDPLNQHNKSFDSEVWDSHDQKNRSLHDVIADDREEDDLPPTLSAADLEVIKGELFDREYQVVVERLGGATQAEIGRKLGLTAQRISQIQAEATAKIRRVMEKRGRTPSAQERRHEAMAWATLACSARQQRVADGDPDQKRAVESKEDFDRRRFNYWGLSHDVSKCRACQQLKALGVGRPELWSGQMPGPSQGARQQNRRFHVEWANYDINPLTGKRCHPTRQLSALRRSKATPWYVDDHYAKPPPRSFDEEFETPEIDAAEVDGKARKRFDGFDKKDPKLDHNAQASMTRAGRLRRVLQQYGVDGSVPFEEAVARAWGPEPPPTFVCDMRSKYKICRRPEAVSIDAASAEMRRAA